MLAWLRVDADGQQKPDEALVFSNEVGEPLRLFHRSWQTLVLRAQPRLRPQAERSWLGVWDELRNWIATAA